MASSLVNGADCKEKLVTIPAKRLLLVWMYNLQYARNKQGGHSHIVGAHLVFIRIGSRVYLLESIMHVAAEKSTALANLYL